MTTLPYLAPWHPSATGHPTATSMAARASRWPPPVRVPLESRPTAELATAARGGDPEACGELFRRLHLRARRAASAFCAESDADDAVAEGWSRAIARIGQLRDPAAVEGWMVRCVVRSAIDLSRQRRRQQPTDAIARLAEGSGQWGESAAEEAFSALDRASMAAVLHDLPPDLRQLLYLRYEAGLSIQHIAAVLGRPAGTVSRRCLEARRLAGQRFLGRHLRPAPGTCATMTDVLCRLPYRPPSARVRRRASEHLGRCPACRDRQAELAAVLREYGGRPPPPL